jgi:hypothetical protein
MFHFCNWMGDSSGLCCSVLTDDGWSIEHLKIGMGSLCKIVAQ